MAGGGWRSKVRTASQALADLPGDARVYVGGNAATPRALCRALGERAAASHGRMTASHVLLLGDDPVPYGGTEVRHRAWFVGPADRAQVASGDADYVPCHLSEIPRLIRELPEPLDAALLTVAPPDAHGYLSLGVEVMASLAAASHAERVIVQVNHRMPRVRGQGYLHVDQVHAVVEEDEELPELIPAPPTDVERAIATHVLTLVPDRATLQLGIGGIPDAVVAALGDRRDLGVHSEMISDGVMDAVLRGQVTGRHKVTHPGKVVTTFVLGSRRLYDWVDDNPGVEAYPCEVTNDLAVASANPRLVAVNSALSVDVTGQVNADSVGRRIYSGVGGQVDFLRAAARSAGGVPIVALPATAKGGTVSRIVSTLAEGAGVVTSRADVHWVVTEYGAVNLYGRTLRARRELLASIAHPRFRDDLLAGREVG